MYNDNKWAIVGCRCGGRGAVFFFRRLGFDIGLIGDED